MIKKISIITFITMLVAGFLINTSYAETENDLDEIQKKREDIQKDLSEKEEKSHHLVSDIKELNKEVKRGNKAIEDKEKQIEKTKEQIEKTIKYVHSLQDDIDDLENGIEERYNILKDRLSSYQKSGGRVNYMDVIFGANNFNDFTSRVSLVTKITESDQTLMEQLKKDTKAVEEKQAITWETLEELNNVKKEQEDALASIDDERQKNEARLVTLSEKKQELDESRDELQLEDSELASLEKETKASIAAAAKAKEKAEQEKAEREQREQQEREQRAKEKENNEAENDEPESEPEQPDTDKEPVQEPDQDQDTDNDNESDSDNDTDKDEDKKKNDGDDSDKKSFTVNSTAYTVESAGGDGVTAIGIDLKKNPNKKVIAVDPSVIPLRSIVWVEGYGYAIAGDTGGAINGKKIDVFFSSEQKAYAWGVRRVKIEIQ
ncbi:MAG TPA: 3D domain-containing protein [Bacillota bacterium]|nr:3D domain-containing protein [Bacillota bacterium]